MNEDGVDEIAKLGTEHTSCVGHRLPTPRSDTRTASQDSSSCGVTIENVMEGKGAFLGWREGPGCGPHHCGFGIYHTCRSIIVPRPSNIGLLKRSSWRTFAQVEKIAYLGKSTHVMVGQNSAFGNEDQLNRSYPSRVMIRYSCQSLFRRRGEKVRLRSILCCRYDFNCRIGSHPTVAVSKR